LGAADSPVGPAQRGIHTGIFAANPAKGTEDEDGACGDYKYWRHDETP
jgi:hypothetical protein